MRILLIIALFFSCNLNAQTYLFGVVTGGSTPPTTSVYKIVCDGNSLTFGTNYAEGSDSSYPKKLGVLLPISRVINYGVSGQTTIDMINDYSSQIAPQYTADTTSVLVAWEIGNDLYYTGNTDTCKNRIRRYCEYGQATGYLVLVGTAPHRGYSSNTSAGDSPSTYNLKLDTINTWLAANYTDFADKLVDFAGDTRLNDPNNTTYRDADKVHYIGAGYTLIAAAVRTKVDEL